MSKRKAFIEDNINLQIGALLLEIADYEKNVSRNAHKFNAYRAAAAAIQHHPTPVQSGDEARRLKGVGAKIAAKVQEFLDTGKMSKIEKIKSDGSFSAIHELTRVSGIGPAKAKQLADQRITSVDILKKHTDKLNHHQIVGLRHVEDFEVRIPRPEVEQIERKLTEIIRDLDPEFEVEICGSYRRGAESSGDVDALIRHPEYSSRQPDGGVIPSQPGHVGDLSKVVAALQKRGLVTDTLSSGKTKFMGVCRLGPDSRYRRLDLRLIPCDQFACGLLYFTGSDAFNKAMRAHALEQGFTLNEYAVRPVGSTGVPGEPISVQSERDVFECVDYPYKEPWERNV